MIKAKTITDHASAGAAKCFLRFTDVAEIDECHVIFKDIFEDSKMCPIIWLLTKS